MLDQQSISAQTQLPEVPELDTWPALVLSFIQIPLQIRQKGPDDAFADTLLKLLRTADDDKRSGEHRIVILNGTCL